jgi:chromosome segregation ATPase
LFLKITLVFISTAIDKSIRENLPKAMGNERNKDSPRKQTSAQKSDEHTISISELLRQSKNHETKLSDNEEEFKMINARLNKMDKVETEIRKLMKEIKKLSENQNQMQDEISRVTEDVDERFIELRNETEVLKDFVTTAMDKSKTDIDNMLIMTNSLETVVTDLSDSISKDKENIETILTNQERFGLKIEDLTMKLEVVEGIGEKYEDLQKQFEDVDDKVR